MQPVFDQIGGADAIGTAVAMLYVRVLADPKVSGYYAHTDMARLKAHQRAILAAALGGPDEYVGQSIGQAHHGRAVIAASFDAIVGPLEATLGELASRGDLIAQSAATVAPLKQEIVSSDGQAATL
jgi:hemoglobin